MNTKCKICGRVFRTREGFHTHFYKVHGGSAVNKWKYTDEAITWQGGGRPKKKIIEEVENNMNREGLVMVPDGKYHQTIISPKTSFLDIPVVIRVPIKIGRGSVLNIDPNSEGDAK